MTKYKDELVQLLLACNVVGIKPEGITLKSGKKSHWYANCRNIAQTMETLNFAGCLIVAINLEIIMTAEIDMVMGIPEGATLLGQEINNTLISKGFIPDQIYQKRTKPKTHGDAANKFWVTGIRPKRILLFEDVITTGTSTIQFIDKLKEEEPDIEIVGLIALLTRLQLGENNRSVDSLLEERGVNYFPTLTANDVLPYAIGQLPENVQRKWTEEINQEYLAEYGNNSPVLL